MYQTSSASTLWVGSPMPRPNAQMRLFCLPYAGGGAAIFRSWPRLLPDQVEVCPIHLPGRERRHREPALASLAPLLEVLPAALEPYLDLPFAIFGYSNGALIAFELARRLRQEYAPEPLHLLIGGRAAPHAPNTRRSIHRLPGAEFVDEIRRLNGTPEAILRNPEMLEYLLPALRADLAIHETYLYTEEEPLSYPITGFYGADDPLVTLDEARRWAEQTSAEFRLCVFPGDHFFLHGAQQPLLRAISRILLESLTGAFA